MLDQGADHGAQLLENPVRDDPESGKPKRVDERARRLLLLGAYAVLFTRYAIATFLSAFFTQVATGMGISGTLNGIIFAAYPFGMAITSLFASQAIRLFGGRNAVLFGLGATSFLTLLFGLAPDITCGDGTKALFVIAYFLNGLTGALAETACIIMVSNRFQDSLGTVMASIGTVSGVGCMVGPVIGGVLYDAVSDPAWAFRMPFLATAVVPVLLLPAVPYFMPAVPIGADEARQPLSSVLSPSVLLGLLSVALSGILVATLDPTLSYRLSAPPFRLSASWVSLFFMYSSIVYVVFSIPVGWAVDRFPDSARVYKGITAGGFFVLTLTFVFLAPFGTPAWGWGSSDGLQPALNNMPCVAFALVLKGIGSALSNNAIYPDLVLGLPADDEMLQATISGLWNAAYAVGWAAGPLVGGVLYDAFQEVQLCVGDDALPPNCPVHGGHPVNTSHHSSPPPPPPSLAQCSSDGSLLSSSLSTAATQCECDWHPHNGFDGFASSVAVVSLLYTIVLVAAVALNVRGGRKVMPTEAPTLAPLGALSEAPSQAP